MKRLFKILFYPAAVLLMVVYFAPKQQLYYQAEAMARDLGVIFSAETARDTGFGLQLSEGTLYYQDLQIADFERINLRVLLLSNRLDVAPFEFSEAMHAFVPGGVSEASVAHHVFDPMRVHLSAKGTFGSLEGTVHLLNRELNVTLMPSDTLQQSGKAFWLKQFKKDSKGGYHYEMAL